MHWAGPSPRPGAIRTRGPCGNAGCAGGKAQRNTLSGNALHRDDARAGGKSRQRLGGYIADHLEGLLAGPRRPSVARRKFARQRASLAPVDREVARAVGLVNPRHQPILGQGRFRPQGEAIPDNQLWPSVSVSIRYPGQGRAAEALESAPAHRAGPKAESPVRFLLLRSRYSDRDGPVPAAAGSSLGTHRKAGALRGPPQPRIGGNSLTGTSMVLASEPNEAVFRDAHGHVPRRHQAARRRSAVHASRDRFHEERHGEESEHIPPVRRAWRRSACRLKPAPLPPATRLRRFPVPGLLRAGRRRSGRGSPRRSLPAPRRSRVRLPPGVLPPAPRPRS